MDTDELDEGLRYHIAVGFLVSAWSHLEAMLANLFHGVLKPPNTRYSRAIFYSQTALNPKLQLIETVIDVMPLEAGHEVAKCWKPLKCRIQAEATLRNQVIHGSLVSTNAGTGNTPPVLDPRSKLTDAEGRLVLEDHEDLGGSYNRLNLLATAIEHLTYLVGQPHDPPHPHFTHGDFAACRQAILNVPVYKLKSRSIGG
jgi:hypothetical protein